MPHCAAFFDLAAIKKSAWFCGFQIFFKVKPLLLFVALPLKQQSAAKTGRGKEYMEQHIAMGYAGEYHCYRAYEEAQYAVACSGGVLSEHTAHK